MPKTPILLNTGNPEFPVDDVKIAMELATKFRDAGHFDIFRGQLRKWPLAPTLHRPGVDKKAQAERFKSFGYWVHTNEELRSLWGQPEAICAVAQHYGMPTPFLDFTRDPEIAGYFATSTVDKGRSSETELCCIVCLNSEHVQEVWREYNELSIKKNGHQLVNLVALWVNNLWRLQAQKGLFLDIRVPASQFETVTPIAWITFPFTSKTSDLDASSVYPTNRSQLEIALDQYFVVEQYPFRATAMRELAAEYGADIHRLEPEDRTEYFINSAIPDDHPTWTLEHLGEWIVEVPMSFSQLTKLHIVLRFDFEHEASRMLQTMRDDILSQIESVFARREAIVSWSIVDKHGASILLDVEQVDFCWQFADNSDDLDDDPNDDEVSFVDASKVISDAASQIFDGMRYLPFTDVEISTAIATYICMVIRGGYQAMNELHGPTAYISMEGSGMRANSYVGWEGIGDAIRPDWDQLLRTDVANRPTRTDVRGVLGTLTNPKKLFSFPAFSKLFAEQLIASQAYCRSDAGQIIFNPAKVYALGLD